MATGTATSGSDVIFATRNGELIDGLAGNDKLASSYRDTTLIGNAGDDLLLGIGRIREAGSTTEVQTSSELHGDDGNDVLTSALEFDLSAEAKVIGNLSIDGGTGNDTIASAVDVDASDGGFLFLDSWRVTAGPGRDLISLAAEFGGSDANINVFAEDGDDWITTIVDGRGIQQDLDGGAGKDHIFSRLTAEGFLGNAYGGSGDDIIRLNVVLRTAESFAGVRVEGNDGDDHLFAQVDRASPSGGTGFLGLFGGFGNDRLDAVIVSGAAGASRLVGEEGDDTLSVSGGGTDPMNSNSIEGGAGNDNMTGSGNADKFVYDGAELSNGVLEGDVATNFQSGVDKIALPNGADDVNSWIIDGRGLLLTFQGDGDNLLLQNVFNYDQNDFGVLV